VIEDVAQFGHRELKDDGDGSRAGAEDAAEDGVDVGMIQHAEAGIVAAAKAKFGESALEASGAAQDFGVEDGQTVEVHRLALTEALYGVLGEGSEILRNGHVIYPFSAQCTPVTAQDSASPLKLLF
jgi:hypothetical protein